MKTLEIPNELKCNYQTNFDRLHIPKHFEFCEKPAFFQSEISGRCFCKYHHKIMNKKGIL